MRHKAHDLSPDVPVKFTTMEALVAEHVAAPRFRALLVGLFAAVALCLAIVGIFGVMVYIVCQRTAEIGLRMALGATPTDVLWLLLRRGLVLASLGLAAGVGNRNCCNTLLEQYVVSGQAERSDDVHCRRWGLSGSRRCLRSTFRPGARPGLTQPRLFVRSDYGAWKEIYVNAAEPLIQLHNLEKSYERAAGDSSSFAGLRSTSLRASSSRSWGHRGRESPRC